MTVELTQEQPEDWWDVEALYDLCFAPGRTALSGSTVYAAEKRRLLSVTRDMRLEMAQRVCEENHRRSLVELKGQLEEIFSDATLSGDDRRRLVFRLWDDCAESGDESTVLFGRLARSTIESYIRRYLPRGSPGAYTPEDLVALNATRRSRRRFEPYQGG